MAKSWEKQLSQINYLWSRMKWQPEFGPDLNTREGDSRLEFYYPRLNEWKCEFTLRLDSEFDDGPDVIPDIQDQYTTICLWIYREKVES